VSFLDCYTVILLSNKKNDPTHGTSTFASCEGIIDFKRREDAFSVELGREVRVVRWRAEGGRIEPYLWR
jgi:hypothetical protein